MVLKREKLIAGVMLTRSYLIKGEGMKSRCLVPVDVMELSFSPMDSLTPSFLFCEEKQTSVWLTNDFLGFCYFFFFLRFLNATLSDIHI